MYVTYLDFADDSLEAIKKTHSLYPWLSFEPTHNQYASVKISGSKREDVYEYALDYHVGSGLTEEEAHD